MNETQMHQLDPGSLVVDTTNLHLIEVTEVEPDGVIWGWDLTEGYGVIRGQYDLEVAI